MDKELFYKLQRRERILLRNCESCICDEGMELFIADCENIANRDLLFELNQNHKELIKIFKQKYLAKVNEQCGLLKRSTKPTLDIIIGLPGAGKSKIIKMNEYMKDSFKADADAIKTELADLLKCNINSKLLHEISTEIRDEAFRVALKNGCNIVIEKVGKSVESICELAEQCSKYNVNLRLIHCNPATSRLRNAIRFQKYNDEKSGKIARFVPDEFIKSTSDKPLETFYRIIHSEKLRSRFALCEAYIQESLYEIGKQVELLPLFIENENLEQKYINIKNYIIKAVENTEDGDKLSYKMLCDLYTTASISKTRDLIEIENGNKELLDSFIEQYLQSGSGTNKYWGD